MTVAFAAIVVVGCTPVRAPSIEVDAVSRIDDSCALPSPPGAALAVFGGGAYGEVPVSWTGGVVESRLRESLGRSAASAGLTDPGPAELSRLRNDVDEAVLATYPERRSVITMKTEVGQSLAAYAVRCDYHVNLHRGGDHFDVTINGGSGRWDIRPVVIDVPSSWSAAPRTAG
ncbi:hypothetical protein [Tsukamurella paurometabola]|uniref:hypothetical protein n=1 Tax=Tsukamurella paurometabola TaxID=2061 RepID=UPI000F7F00AE|nr:hypothetical protein [Tsukamurella paurometabola]UEA83064.1 hypothetical protein LK411_22360 [Tsukamurella paurometabola]